MPATAQTRITGGEWRGRLLSTPRQQLLRPTRSMVRQALFNILGDEVIGTSVVDLFAGAGTVGFEALSRGATEVAFVERDERALAHIRASAQTLSCASRCQVVRAEALGWVRSGSSTLIAAGLVFVDAPYRDDVVMDVLDVLGELPARLVVCEHHRARSLPDRVGDLVMVRHGRYGLTDLSVYRPAVKGMGISE